MVSNQVGGVGGLDHHGDVPNGSAGAGPGGSPLYLESERTTPEQEFKPTGRMKCKRLGCGCVWCPNGCGMALGLTLRDALKAELETFQSPYFVTCTINQDLFSGPEDALRWVQTGGVVSEFVRVLRRAGVLLDKRYASFMEFQENGWPHWHLIFDAQFVPFDLLCEAWAAAGWSGKAGRERWGERPKFEGKGQKPVFGGVCFRMKGRQSLGGLCHYVTMYVTQMPENGWPAWLEKSHGQLRRWSTSRDFWRHTPSPRSAVKVTEWSKLRGKYFDPDEEWVEDDEFLRKIGKTSRSIGQRIESCGTASVVLEEVEVPPDVPGEKWVLKWRWVGMISADVWRDPEQEAPTFKRLDDVGRGYFDVSDPDHVRLLRSLISGGGGS